MRCRNCGGQYFSENGIPVLFKNGHPSESVEYLIRTNMDDTIHFLGEDYYKRRGHDKYLVRALGARAGEIILDLGCGHGHISKWIAESCSATVVSYDILLPVLLKVSNPLAVCGSADNLVFGDNVFDRVICTDVMEHIPPSMEDSVISEIFRVLKPGGVIYLDYPGNKLPFWTGLPIVNLARSILGLFGGKARIVTLKRQVEAHVNFSYPHLINRLWKKHGFLGKARPYTTRMFSIPEPYRTLGLFFANIFPCNYLFSGQMVGHFRKPLALTESQKDNI